jgi:hypothetical protein
MSPRRTRPTTVVATPTRAGQFARNSVFGTLAGGLIALGGVIANIIVAQCLGVENTGVVAFALWVALVTAAIVDLGFQATLARYLPELIAAGREREAQRLSGALLRPLSLCCGIALSAFAGYAIWQQQSGRGGGLGFGGMHLRAPSARRVHLRLSARPATLRHGGAPDGDLLRLPDRRCRARIGDDRGAGSTRRLLRRKRRSGGA